MRLNTSDGDGANDAVRSSLFNLFLGSSIATAIIAKYNNIADVQKKIGIDK